MLLLTSCGDNEPGSNRPTIAAVTPPPRTPLPDATVPCAGDPTQLCVADADLAQHLRAREARDDEVDRQFCWLRTWFGYDPCPVD